MELLNIMELLKYCRFIKIFMNFIEISKERLKKRRSPEKRFQLLRGIVHTETRV